MHIIRCSCFMNLLQGGRGSQFIISHHNGYMYIATMQLLVLNQCAGYIMYNVLLLLIIIFALKKICTISTPFWTVNCYFQHLHLTFAIHYGTVCIWSDTSLGSNITYLSAGYNNYNYKIEMCSNANTRFPARRYTFSLVWGSNHIHIMYEVAFIVGISIMGWLCA